MKALSLNKTWTECLRMWKWIAKEWTKNKKLSVSWLKQEWLRKHGYKASWLETKNCFFCAYANSAGRTDGRLCFFCPARIVSKRFRCTNHAYFWQDKPVRFYKKLVKLNEKRKAKK